MTDTNTELVLQSPQIQDVIQYFAAAQDVKQSSRDLYRRAVSLFFDWVTSTGRQVQALTAADVIQYKEQLLEGGLSALTVGGYVNALRRFYAWTEANKISHYGNRKTYYKPIIFYLWRITFLRHITDNAA